MFSALEPPGFHIVVPGIALVPERFSPYLSDLKASCVHDWDVDVAVPWRIGGRRCSRCNATGHRDSLGRIVEDGR